MKEKIQNIKQAIASKPKLVKVLKILKIMTDVCAYAFAIFTILALSMASCSVKRIPYAYNSLEAKEQVPIKRAYEDEDSGYLGTADMLGIQALQNTITALTYTYTSQSNANLDGRTNYFFAQQRTDRSNFATLYSYNTTTHTSQSTYRGINTFVFTKEQQSDNRFFKYNIYFGYANTTITQSNYTNSSNFTIYLALVWNTFFDFLGTQDATILDSYFAVAQMGTGTDNYLYLYFDFDEYSNVGGIVYNYFISDDKSYEEGYIDGYHSGYNNATNDAYTDGYNDGYEQGQTGTSSNPFVLISNAFRGIADLLDIQIIPGLNLGVLIFTPVVITIIILIVKMVRG